MTPGSDVILTVRVIPRAARSAIAGTRDDALLVRLCAPPVDGAANDELIRLLAEELDIPKRHIEIITGHRSRTKRVRITGVANVDIAGKLCIPKPTS